MDARKGEAKRKKRDDRERRGATEKRENRVKEKGRERERERAWRRAAKLTHAVTLERRPSPPFSTDAAAVRCRPSTAADESLAYAARSALARSPARRPSPDPSRQANAVDRLPPTASCLSSPVAAGRRRRRRAFPSPFGPRLVPVPPVPAQIPRPLVYILRSLLSLVSTPPATCTHFRTGSFVYLSLSPVYVPSFFPSPDYATCLARGRLCPRLNRASPCPSLFNLANRASRRIDNRVDGNGWTPRARERS